MCFHDVYGMWRTLVKNDGGEGERPWEPPTSPKLGEALPPHTGRDRGGLIDRD